jgi:glucose-1-phosphate thymidylyltransferase
MKGIILAGGMGTRLYPSTAICSKQILTVYDKPMIYYPLSTLMLAGIRDILIISTQHDINLFKELFNNGNDLGLNISYAIQNHPNGLAEAFIIGENFIDKDNVALILGDNIFYGYNFTSRLKTASNIKTGATIFGYHVNNPEHFGVISFDNNENVIDIQEKPKHPKSNYIVPGLYFYDNSVIEISKHIKKSERGELEITSVNNEYLKRKKLKVQLLGRGTAWFDVGTHKELLNAANFIEAMQTRQGLYIACLEEIAYNNGFINKEKLLEQAEKFKKCDYSKYIYKIVHDKT